MAIINMNIGHRDTAETIERFCEKMGWRFVLANDGRMAIISDSSIWRIVHSGGVMELYHISIFAEPGNSEFVGTYVDVASLLETISPKQYGA